MNAPIRRGVCPRLSAPMATGDGLLARLIPSGATIGLDAFAKLCAAARSHGNGIIEITSRGSIQIRGLSAASTAAFAAGVGPLDIDCGDVVPILMHPLAGLEPEETIDTGALVQDLRRALGLAPFVQCLAAKVSAVVDGGAALHLDQINADIRLRAIEAAQGRLLHVAVGGDASTATPLGAVAPDRAVECVMRLLGGLADAAPRARMRDLPPGALEALGKVVADLIIAVPPPTPRPPASAIGVHSLRAGAVALGLGLPFGHSDAETLGVLLEIAKRSGAAGMRTAPGRTLLVPGLSPASAHVVAAQASALGFIVDPADPRCKVIACVGAPACASGQIPSRALAPLIAQLARAGLADRDIVHVSGCAKGCAHPAPAAVAVFGRDGVCDIQVDGRPAGCATVEELPEKIAHVLQSRQEPERG